jgi:hypothetical protein
MRTLSNEAENTLRNQMARKGLGKRSIDTYMSSIRKAADFFEVNPVDLIRFVHSTNSEYHDKNTLGEYMYNIYAKANPMVVKKAYDFRSHMRMVAEIALQTN